MIQRYSATPYGNRAATFQSPAGETSTYIAVVNTETNGASGILFGDHAGQNAGNFDAYINYSHQYQHMQFLVGSGTERLRIKSDGDVSINDGNLVIATSGHGIDFSAQTASSATGASNTAEILDHYEEGSWTPTTSQGAAHTVFGTPTYTRIGRQVTIICYINITSSSSSDAVRIDGLPFTALGSSHFSIGNCYTQFTADKHVFFQVTSGAAQGFIYTGL